MRMTKKFFVFAVVAASLMMTACSIIPKDNTDTGYYPSIDNYVIPDVMTTPEMTADSITDEVISQDYTLTIEISRTENLLFSTYDVAVILDDVQIGSIANGEDFDYSIKLPAGDHALVFCKESDMSLKKERQFTTSSNSTLKCSVSTKRNEIEISGFSISAEESAVVPDLTRYKLDEAKELLKNEGFTNVHSKSEGGAGIWVDSNWIVTGQDPAPMTEMPTTSEITLTCIKFDSFLSAEFEGLSIDEVQGKAEELGFKKVIYYDKNEYKDITRQIEAMSEEELKGVVIVSAEDASDDEKKVRINLDGVSSGSKATEKTQPSSEAVKSIDDAPDISDFENNSKKNSQSSSDRIETDDVIAVLDVIMSQKFEKDQYRIEVGAENTISIYFNIKGSAVTATSALMGNKDAIKVWNETMEGIKTFSADASEAVSGFSGSNLMVYIVLLNDVDNDKVLAIAWDDMIIYDPINKINILNIG